MIIKKSIGLFFGSFNPVHVGHMIIANYMVEHTGLSEVWMVVSPQNPFKQKDSLAPDRERLHMIRLAISNNVKLRASDVEFGLPIPSYTVDTLAILDEKYPQYDFSIIMGGDNLPTLPKWKNYEVLLSKYQIYVYHRPSYDLGPLQEHPHVHLVNAPLLDLSASFVRQCIKEGKSIQYMVPDSVFEYIDGSKLYK